MAYDEKLADRVREALVERPDVAERKMFQGMCFMVNGKMCICVRDNELMCRIDPEAYEEVLEKKKCRPMVHNGKAMRGFVFVPDEGIKAKKDFDYWMALTLDFNKRAKASRKKKK